MADFVKITVLFMGQGLSQLMEVRDPADGSLKKLILADCGIESLDCVNVGAADAKSVNIDYIKQNIEDNQYCLDILMISHLDFDHISALVRPNGILDYLIAHNGTITKLLIGGTPRPFAALRPFTEVKKKPKGVSAAQVALAEKLLQLGMSGKSGRYFCGLNHYVFAHSGGTVIKRQSALYTAHTTTQAGRLECYLRVVGNRMFAGTADLNSASYINNNSIVLAAEFCLNGVLLGVVFLTGDIQWEGMQKLHNDFNRYKTCYDFLPANGYSGESVMVAPHHGALNTACKASKLTGAPLAQQLADTGAFANDLGCRYIIVSARTKRLNHPCEQVLDVLSPNVIGGRAAHDNYVVSVHFANGRIAKWNYTARTVAGETRAIYTTFIGPENGPAAARRMRNIVIAYDDTGAIRIDNNESAGE